MTPSEKSELKAITVEARLLGEQLAGIQARLKRLLQPPALESAEAPRQPAPVFDPIAEVRAQLKQHAAEGRSWDMCQDLIDAGLMQSALKLFSDTIGRGNATRSVEGFRAYLFSDRVDHLKLKNAA